MQYFHALFIAYVEMHLKYHFKNLAGPVWCLGSNLGLFPSVSALAGWGSGAGGEKE